MNKLIFIVLLSTIAALGCSNVKNIGTENELKADSSNIKSLIDFASDCTKDQSKNSEFCACKSWASDKTGNLFYPNSGLAQGDQYYSLVDKLLGYFDRLSSCEIHAPIDLGFELPPNSSLAQKILLENKGNTLSPEMVNSVAKIDKDIGWKFKMYFSNKNYVNMNKSVFVYQGGTNEGEQFKYLGYTSESEHLFINGLKYYKKENEYAVTDEEKCKFVLGECAYKVGDTIKKKYTKYVDGIWVSNKSDFGVRSRALEKNIYDSSGLPLYRSYQAKARDIDFEEVRYESGT